MALTAAQSALVDRTLRKIDAYDAPGSNIVASEGEVYVLLQEAARHLLLTVPLRLLHGLIADKQDEVNLETVAHQLRANAGFKIPLPTDFVRLVEFALTGWTMARTHEDLRQDSVVTRRRYLTGESATTRKPEVFSTYMGTTTAAGLLTLTANLSDGDTVTIDTTVYTFQDTLTDVDGNVHIGATASDTIDNLVAAIGLGSGAGTDYATSMTVHPTCTAVAGPLDTMIVNVTATETNVATTETSSTASWNGATTTYLLTREGIDAYPGSSDADTPVATFLYVPDTVPESMPAALTEAMLWEAAGQLVTAIDPQLSQLCFVRSREMIEPRIMRHRSAFTRTPRPMGL